jgi:hypothetical protein
MRSWQPDDQGAHPISGESVIGECSLTIVAWAGVARCWWIASHRPRGLVKYLMRTEGFDATDAGSSAEA